MTTEHTAQSNNTRQRIAVIGAGPVGLEAAVAAARLGYPFNLYEAGDAAANVRSWGRVVLFTPFSMNHSQAGAEAIRADSGADRLLPTDDALLSGDEYTERYLQPLASSSLLSKHVHLRHRVIAVGRSGLLKSQAIGSPERAKKPFCLLVETNAGQEKIVEADIVIDASGVYQTPNRIGPGGIYTVGERSLNGLISYHLDDITGVHRERYIGKRTLLVGSGYSAATSIVSLHTLVEADAKTEITWLTHGQHHPPIHEIENDRLPARHALARQANRIAMDAHQRIRHEPGAVVERLEPTDRGTVRAHIADRKGKALTVEVDRILANVGYQPDRSLYAELQVHECYATMAPMRLAASLMKEASADCLDRQASPAETLVNPESGFFILGMKSYGRDPTFLIQTGIAQVSQAFSLLSRSV